MAVNRSGFEIEVGTLPEDSELTLNEFLQALPDLVTVVLNEGFSTFVTGATAPTSNQGPWLKDGLEWWVWDDTLGRYRPQQLEEEFRKIYIQSFDPFVKDDINNPNPDDPLEGSLWYRSRSSDPTEFLDLSLFVNGAWRLFTKSDRERKDEDHPIGDVYFNRTDNTNPATLLGMPWSTWVPLTDAYIAARGGDFDDDGGSNSFELALNHDATVDVEGHELTQGEIPELLGQLETVQSGAGSSSGVEFSEPSEDDGPNVDIVVNAGGGAPHDHNADVSVQDHNETIPIQPRYTGLYTWYRTA